MAIADAHVVPIHLVVVGLERRLLLVAVHRVRDQGPAVLQQIGPDLATCSREVIEGV